MLGRDFAGRVAEADPGVPFQAGDKVWSFTDWSGPRIRDRRGACAERISFPISQMSLMPSTLSFEHAAALPLVSLTAWQVDARLPA